jgi:patatin-like phospholipase/acyl hydrolase
MTKNIRVLSIDGGGIRGILPAMFLTSLEQQSGQPISRLFDMIAGTSTGAILACCLAKPKPLPAEKIADAYIAKVSRIFSGSRWRNIGSLFYESKYDHRFLEEVLDEYMGDVYLSACHPYVLIPIYDLGNREAKFLKSWRANGILSPAGETPADADFLIRTAVRAATAAPTYFEPALIHNRAGTPFTCIDGAVFANNPSMCALASVRKLWPESTTVVLVSVGTGEFRRPVSYEKARSWGTLSWTRPVIDCMMDGTSDTVDYQLREIFSGDLRYFRFQTQLGGPEDPQSPSDAIDDASTRNIRKLIIRGQAFVDQSAGDIAELASLLTPRH